MKRHLVVLARIPRLGQGKRRLAREIGDMAAWRFARASLIRTLRDLRSPLWQCWLAVTPETAALAGLPLRQWHVTGQGRGDLGQRMARPLRSLPPGPVVLVGSDIPDLQRRHIAAAFAQLGRHQAVFGPAQDGGFYLVGLRRRPRLVLPYKGVRWSSRHALADTLGNLDTRVSTGFVETLADIDDKADWEGWRARAFSAHA